ncbi:hypothetical protein [Victivallis sp. Marseille-Q1083]|uniref:hypothetical protein n=1 Tax=Victivallis sp. Marseille-Q1083 TaxID=2717288 RepID=UPI00158CD07E|nr:hypothetical protein [Victivallis sp. Marseille-Q1083]
MTDKEMIIRALQLWFLPGDVFEIRILDAVSVDWMRPHMESGYFDYEHIPAAADAIAKLRSYRGAYVTINPVKSDLLARACNRIRGITREPTTADSDIAERRWLLIDCDPKRVSGVSSTDAEHKAAIQKARELRDDMASVTWPEPVICDSGNGAQMLYRASLPPDDEGLIQRTIESLSSASTDAVEIDKTVHNPARIWRIPGTMNCKGDSIPARPHRMAQLLSVPSTLSVLSREQLERVANFTAQPQKPVATAQPHSVSDEFDLDSWVRQYCPELEAPKVWKDGRKWVFPVCPFNDAHANRSAVLIQHANGAIAFTCHHNSCSGNDWKKLRELKEPGCYERKPEPAPVDLTGILNQGRKLAKNDDKLFPNPGAIPERLLKMPGYVADVMKLTMDTAPYPNTILAFIGALADLAFLAGRKVKDERNNRSNLYLIALADSGTGKDHPRKVNFNIAFAAGMGACIGDAFASGEGLEDALFMHPSMLFQTDEIDSIFNTMKYNKDQRTESMNEKLLKFYGAANSIYPLRRKALVKTRSNGDREEIECIVNPNLVIFGTAIPKYFYEAMSRRVLENGLAARCIIIEAGKRGRGKSQREIIPSDETLRAAKYIVNIDSLNGNLCSINPKPMLVPDQPDATVLLEQIQHEFDDLVDFYKDNGEDVASAVWARGYEKVCKLAMLYALSENVYNPSISCKAVKWARDFIEYVNKRTLFMAEYYVYESQFEEKCQKVVRLIDRAGGKIGHSKLLRSSHESLDVFKKIIDTLIENGTISFEIDTGKTKPMKNYVLL